MLDVIYEDSDIVVINKPHGLHSISDRQKLQKNTVKSLLEDIYGKIFIVHRLDAGTGGVMVCAKNPQSHSNLCNQFENKKVEKQYLAICSGCFDYGISVFLPIGKKPSRGKYKVNFKSGSSAITTFLPISSTESLSLVIATPFTGRTHQIRVHLKALGYPLYSDFIYGTRADNKNYLSLFSLSLKFIHPVNYNCMSFTAPISNYMQSLIKNNTLFFRNI